MVNKARSAANASGVAYGATAYKQGLYDGIKLMSEVNRIGQNRGILNEQGFDCNRQYRFDDYV